MLVFGGRLIFLLRKRHRNLAIELDLTPLYWTRANFKIAAWLKARRFEELNDSVTERAARRLSDAKPILMLMGLAGIVAALYVVLSAR